MIVLLKIVFFQEDLEVQLEATNTPITHTILMVRPVAQAVLEVLEDQVDPEDLADPEAQVSIYCSKTSLNTNIFSNSRT